MRAALDRGRWSPPVTSMALVTSMIVALYVCAVVSLPGLRGWPEAATFAGQLLPPVALAGAAFVGMAWRVQASASLGWLTAAATMIGIQSVSLMASSTTDSLEAARGVFSTSVAVGVALLLLVRIAERRALEVEPLAVGLAVGLTVLVARGAWLALPLPTPTTDTAVACASALLVLLGLVLAIAIRRASTLPLGATRLSWVVVTWSLSSAIGALGWTTAPAGAVVAIATGLAACALGMSAAVDLLRRVLHDEHEAVARMQTQLHTLRGRVEQLHEVKGTIAGIASATDLIRHEGRLSSQHRDRLEEMLAQEAARLQRLVRTSPAPRVADLDDIIQPLVVARQVQGQRVEWEPPDVPVLAEVDTLAEVVNILLHNAAQHAPGATVRISCRMRDGELQLVVADNGRGVPEHLRARIFEWGYSGEGSSGQGVGLALARRMMVQHGCDLWLDEGDEGGARFVLELKQSDQEDVRGAARLLIS